MGETIDHQFVASIEIGDEFKGVYYVDSCYIKQTVQQKDYTDLMLRDRSGVRNAKHWGTITDLDVGRFIYVAGRCEDYQGSPSIILKNVQIEANEPEDMSVYLDSVEEIGDLADRLGVVQEAIASDCEESGDGTCVGFWEEAFRDGKFFGRFIDSPHLSASPYYSKRGGVLLRAVRIAEQFGLLAEQFDVSAVGRSIGRTAAVLGSVGAVDAYAYDGPVPTETEKGLLIGMSGLTMFRLTSVTQRLMRAAREDDGPNVVMATVTRLFHAIVTGTGGCSVQPMTVEAMLLLRVGQADTDMTAAIEFIRNDVNGEALTAYDSYGGTRYFVGGADAPAGNG